MLDTNALNEWRFRCSIFGRMILQRAYRTPAEDVGCWDIYWKDATVSDLADYYTNARGE